MKTDANRCCRQPLDRLLHGLGCEALPAAIEVGGLHLDSRAIMPGDAFFALAGSSSHGLRFAGEAAARGAVAVLYDPASAGEELIARMEGDSFPPLIPVPNLKHKLGVIADRFYGAPSSRLDVIGISGTNGKTSTSHFLAQALSECEPCGVIGTLGWGFSNRLRETRNTTPDAVALHTALAVLADEGAKAVAMEVSSHGLDQGRSAGVRFKGGVYTNISRDHLDYHGTMEAYVEAKLKLLEAPGLEFVVVNLDDPYAGRILGRAPAILRKYGFSLKGASARGVSAALASHIVHGHEGLSFNVDCQGDSRVVRSPLFGDFNVENLMATLLVLIALGIPFDQAVGRIGRVRAVPGRMERFIHGHHSPTVVVDYAHTPHALECLLGCLRSHCRGALWVVFGCGGDRDRGKRPQMGRIAARWADRPIVTDDNPRSEAGDDIIRDILAGCHNAGIEVIRDRGQAIRYAVGQAGADDVVVVAGKGHETAQEVMGVKYAFSDRAVVEDALSGRFGVMGGAA